MTACPTIAWLTNGAHRQLESFAREPRMPAEALASELVTEGLRALDAPPAPDHPVPPVQAVLTDAMRERMVRRPC
ncbi:hypothetical protein [Paraburkholderia sp. J10-1]|uniref:hypothetical protein n=1 Tax=Paraburkholderia sp. J10-1 TaxID=2805430 RepID=UPI002AB65584|nr:hypothetical protein [Paraburkholderia sp. J10-1]